MMFASKTPRDLNHDSEPWVTNEVEPMRFGPELMPRRDDRFDPRPEFDHVQHNEPNPILLDFRDSGGNAMEWRDVIESRDGDAFLAQTPREFGHIIPGHIVHAIRVLNRLARIEERGGES